MSQAPRSGATAAATTSSGWPSRWAAATSASRLATATSASTCRAARPPTALSSSSGTAMAAAPVLLAGVGSLTGWDRSGPATIEVGNEVVEVQGIAALRRGLRWPASGAAMSNNVGDGPHPLQASECVGPGLEVPPLLARLSRGGRVHRLVVVSDRSRKAWWLAPRYGARPASGRRGMNECKRRAQ